MIAYIARRERIASGGFQRRIYFFLAEFSVLTPIKRGSEGGLQHLNMACRNSVRIYYPIMRSRQDDFFFYFAFHTRYFVKRLLSIYFYDDVGGALDSTRVRPIFRHIKNSHGGKIIVQYITHRVYQPFKRRYIILYAFTVSC